eukprot:6765256-Alexandrium_andersonii.AAC.1
MFGRATYSINTHLATMRLAFENGCFAGGHLLVSHICAARVCTQARVRARACVHACVSACVNARADAWARARVHAYTRAHGNGGARAPKHVRWQMCARVVRSLGSRNWMRTSTGL